MSLNVTRRSKIRIYDVRKQVDVTCVKVYLKDSKPDGLAMWQGDHKTMPHTALRHDRQSKRSPPLQMNIKVI